jgi:glycogen(starch) synthase
MDGVELEIIGSGPEDSELRSLAARLGLLERVTFRGALSREETWRRLREDAGLLVLPSSYEGMPHVVLEAFAAGVPVVASAAGGTPEVVEHGVSGLLYRCRAVGELRAALERGLEPATAGKLVEGGSKVARRLTLEGMTAATRSVLEEVAEPA